MPRVTASPCASFSALYELPAPSIGVNYASSRERRALALAKLLALAAATMCAIATVNDKLETVVSQFE
jgi:hypothetical protein